MVAEAYESVHEGTSSERNIMAWVGALGALIIVGLCVWAARWATPPNLGFTETANEAGILDGGAASVLAMVSIVAVGIERMIEMFWSLMSSFKNGWWPLPEIAKAVDALAEETNQVARPAFAAAIEGLEAAKATLAEGDKQRQLLEGEIKRLEDDSAKYEAQIKRISSLAKDNQRVQLIATTTFQAVNRLDTAYGSVMPAVRQAFNDASQVTAGVSDILAGFKDNPAKKIISIMLGAAAGLIVSGIVGLDLFAAAGMPLGPTEPGAIAGSAFPYIGVMLTGLVVGLGANPTHEVVRWVSESAKSRRASNLGRPNVSGSPDERDERAAAPKKPADAATSILERLRPIGGDAAARARPGTMNLR
jgi:hypothetical protein